MNFGITLRILGFLLLGLCAAGSLPLLVSIIHGDRGGPWPWLLMMALAGLIAAAMLLYGRRATGNQLGIREGIAVTSLVWIFASFIGGVGIRLAVPEISFIAAWFESMSGFTTTGSTVFGGAIGIDELPRGVLLWRSLMQWLGGLGIVVISLSLLPLITGGGGFSLYRAEMPGITNERLAPRIADTARLLVALYGGITVLITLGLWICGGSFFHAFCHGLTTIATGGFSSYANSVEGFDSAAAEWVVIVGMILGGLSFAMLLSTLRGKPLSLWRNAETRLFLCLLLAAVALGTVVMATQSDIYAGKPHELIRHSAFNIISTGTSSGFATGFQASPEGNAWAGWPSGIHILIIILMITGGCTGGTAGGSKIIRWVVAIRALRSELRRFVEPARVTAVTIDGKTLDARVLLQVGSFFVVLALCWGLGSLLIALSGNDAVTAAGAALTCVINNGPGFGEVGVDRHFADIGPVSQLVCMALMLVGRLEFFGIIALCSWRHWQR